MKKTAKVSAVAMASCLLVFVGATVYAVSKSVKSEKNSFTPAEIKIAVQETNGKDSSGSSLDALDNTSPQLENQLEWKLSGDSWTATKQVKIANLDESGKNNADAFVRVCILPRWTAKILDSDGNAVEDGDGNAVEVDVTNTDGITEIGDFVKEINDNSYQMGAVVFTLNKDWEENWIYNPNDGYFYCRKAVKPGEATPLLLESVTVSKADFSNLPEGVSLKVDVLADAIQTEGDDSREVSALETRWGTPETLGVEIKNSDGELILTEYTAPEQQPDETEGEAEKEGETEQNEQENEPEKDTEGE